jgi:peptidoglycan hydrolase CwlO-like protein
MKKRMGFIAQDVQLLFPDLVCTEGDYLGLSYSDFGVLSIEAIKELRAEKDAEIERLNQENTALKNKLDTMQAQIDRINEYLEISSQK